MFFDYPIFAYSGSFSQFKYPQTLAKCALHATCTIPKFNACIVGKIKRLKVKTSKLLKWQILAIE